MELESRTLQPAVAGVKRLLIWVFVVLVLGVSTSFVYKYRYTIGQYREMAAVTGRTFFFGQVVTRSWNAAMGGVYVPITDAIKPNPYLQDPLRDIITTKGRKLTKINPAFMTRLLSETSKGANRVSFHITSLNPIRPANKPTQWEHRALLDFEKGRQEATMVTDGPHGPTFFYMAPLITKKVCLKCHAKQGYKVGQIRGGIAVSFDYSPYTSAARSDLVRSVVVHLAFVVVVGLMILFLGRRLIKTIEQVGHERQRADTLEGLLPICASCKRIRKQDQDPFDQQSWVAVESYVRDHSQADFTHGICPECAEKFRDASKK